MHSGVGNSQLPLWHWNGCISAKSVMFTNTRLSSSCKKTFSSDKKNFCPGLLKIKNINSVINKRIETESQNSCTQKAKFLQSNRRTPRNKKNYINKQMKPTACIRRNQRISGITIRSSIIVIVRIASFFLDGFHFDWMAIVRMYRADRLPRKHGAVPVFTARRPVNTGPTEGRTRRCVRRGVGIIVGQLKGGGQRWNKQSVWGLGTSN